MNPWPLLEERQFRTDPLYQVDWKNRLTVACLPPACFSPPDLDAKRPGLFSLRKRDTSSLITRDVPRRESIGYERSFDGIRHRSIRREMQ